MTKAVLTAICAMQTQFASNFAPKGRRQNLNPTDIPTPP